MLPSIKTRDDVYDLLCETLGSDHVYFNPPEEFKMSYPCIVFSLSSIDSTHADNGPYIRKDSYELTYIYKSDSQRDMIDKILDIKGVTFDRTYRADGLYHVTFIFRIF